jgi:hypothetical protein
MGRREAVVAVLDLVEMLDQQVASPRSAAKERAHLLESLRVDRATLWLRADLAVLPASLGCPGLF